MKKLHFAIEIKASREHVWNTMLDDKTYRQWAVVFSPGSYYKGDWSKGSKMLFLGPDPQSGEEGGMIGKVAENKLHEFISLEYLGMVLGGKEDTTSEMAKAWTDSGFENYTFKDKNGATELLIDLNVADVLAGDFEKMWPGALEKLKEIAEAK
ncbi:MAG: SRPBCC domain-containing protein [Candidatus Altimarinota bacterium]